MIRTDNTMIDILDIFSNISTVIRLFLHQNASPLYTLYKSLNTMYRINIGRSFLHFLKGPFI